MLDEIVKFKFVFIFVKHNCNFSFSYGRKSILWDEIVNFHFRVDKILKYWFCYTKVITFKSTSISCNEIEFRLLHRRNWVLLHEIEFRLLHRRNRDLCLRKWISLRQNSISLSRGQGICNRGSHWALGRGHRSAFV